MNTNQVKGAAAEAAGTVRRKAGELVGSTEQQAKGAAQEVRGKLQKAVGDVQESLKPKDTSR